MCRVYRPDELVEACSQLSAVRWERLDPDNAAPWLIIAQQANAKHDEATEATAFAHASDAHGLRFYNDALSEFVALVLPVGLPEYDKFVIQKDIATYAESMQELAKQNQIPFDSIVNAMEQQATKPEVPLNQ